MTLVFDPIAEMYDQWFDSTEGKAIYEAELKCLQSLHKQRQGRWLEVGVGTGRFASRMGITEGIDPSPKMLEIAASRHIKIHEGRAENLLFSDSSFDGVLIALALFFISDPEKALKECHRILREEASLLIGDIPAGNPWSEFYEREKANGDPVWSQANFLPATELLKLIEKTGFKLQKAASTLFWTPVDPPESKPRLEPGIVTEAGFLGLLFTRTS